MDGTIARSGRMWATPSHLSRPVVQSVPGFVELIARSFIDLDAIFPHDCLARLGPEIWNNTPRIITGGGRGFGLRTLHSALATANMGYKIEYGGQPKSRPLRGYILVVSHMRSFSSLLCHILGSHGEISGYAETHQSYLGRIDLQELKQRVQATTGEAVSGKYVLDKILHNKISIAPSVLTRPNVKVLFLVRSAEETMRSILNMTHALGHTWLTNPAQVLDYYINRLHRIENYSARLQRNALFVEAEKLIDDTDAVLNCLSRWLDLEQPLTANYRTFKFTGSAGYGDPFPTIMAGEVIKNAKDRHGVYVPLAIPHDVLRKGKEAYADCRGILSKRHESP
jgi:hypothetical protein